MLPQCCKPLYVSKLSDYSLIAFLKCILEQQFFCLPKTSTSILTQPKAFSSLAEVL